MQRQYSLDDRKTIAAADSCKAYEFSRQTSADVIELAGETTGRAIANRTRQDSALNIPSAGRDILSRAFAAAALLTALAPTEGGLGGNSPKACASLAVSCLSNVPARFHGPLTCGLCT